MAEIKEGTIPRRLSEVEAHRLLARAAELDARLDSSVSAEQLISAAVEAGISEEAVAQAAAELEAGKLDAPSRKAVIMGFLATGGGVLISASLVVWLLADASRPIAQLLALGIAVYGAYDLLSRTVRWLKKRRGGSKVRRVRPASAPASERDDDPAAPAMRLLLASPPSRGAA